MVRTDSRGVEAAPVHDEHEVGREVGYAGIALGLCLVARCSTEVVCHDFLASPLGQAGAEGHLRQHWITAAIVLHDKNVILIDQATT